MSTDPIDFCAKCGAVHNRLRECPEQAEPVRDIREAMHPAMSPGMAKADTLTGEERAVYLAGYHEGCIPGDPMPFVTAEPLAPAIGFNFGEADAAGVAMAPDCTHMLTRGSLVATLPDGTRVNLPAGTVLREGEDDDAKQRRGFEIAALDAAAKYVTCGVMGTASEHEDSETKELRRAVGDLLAFLAGEDVATDPDQFFDAVCALIPWEKPDVPERREALRIVGEKIAKADRCECPDFSCSPHYTEEGSR